MSKKLQDLVFQSCSKNDCHTALVYHENQQSIIISYEDIIKSSCQVAELLCSLSPFDGEGITVVLLLHRFHFLVPALILGVLKSNGCFMYLSSELPDNQRDDLLRRSSALFVITDYKEEISGWEEKTQTSVLGRELKILQLIKSTNQIHFQVPEEWSIAYLVHTSGSTGEPKIVRVPHSCIIPNIMDLRDTFNIQQCDVVFCTSPFSFDPSIIDMFLAFSAGAKLILVEPSIKSMPSKVAQIIRDEKVTFLQSTPSFLMHLGPQLCRTHLLQPSTVLRNLVLGGEPFPPLKTLKDFRSPGNQTSFFNIYGITEVSCWSTLSEIQVDADIAIELGRPLSETDLLVTNEKGEEITEGEGLLMVGGRRVCLVDDETPSSIQKPFYRSTGDRVEILNGALYYRGRTDFTVKRMGKRLNLHSVESIALSSGLVQQCCALLNEAQMLILVCIGNGTAEQITKHFELNASAIQRPDEIILVESLPISNHGKVDRRKVLETLEIRPKLKSLDWRTCLKEEWTAATSQSDVQDHSNFILSGGNSLSALKLVNRVQETVARPLPLLLDILLNRSWKDVFNYLNEESIETASTFSHPTTVNIIHRSRPVQTNVDIARVENSEFNLLWKFNMKKCIDASPLVIQKIEGGTVFIGSHSHLFSAVNLEDGKEKWTTELPERIESSACCDPTGMLVFVGCYDGHLYCLDASNGRIRWRFITGDAIKSSPLCTGSSVIFGSHDRHLYSLSLDQGQLLWKRQISGGSLFASPTWNGSDHLLSASLDGTCSALTVTTGSILWTVKLAAPIFSSPVWCQESKSCLLASVDGFLSRHGAETGELVWRFRAAGPIFSTPNVSDSKIIFGSHDHSLYCLNFEDGSQLWRVVFTSPVYSSPIIADSMVCCCDTNGHLRLVGLSDGRQLAAVKLDGEVFSSPVVVDDLIVVGCRDDYLYCYRLNGK